MLPQHKRVLAAYKRIKDKVVTIQWESAWTEESEVLDRLEAERTKHPDDPIYDSLFQFRAQVSGLSRLERLQLSAASCIGFFYLLTKYFVTRVEPGPRADVAYFYSVAIFPQIRQEEHVLAKVPLDAGKLRLEDVAFLLTTLVRLRLCFGVMSIAAHRVAQARFAIDRHNVTELWTTMEYSAACGITRAYCNRHEVHMANFMHGEKVLTLRDAFCSFDSYFVWSAHHREIVETLGCRGEVFVENPWTSGLIKQTETQKACYFLKGTETSAEINNISMVLEELRAAGYEVAFKAHPRRPIDVSPLAAFTAIDTEVEVTSLLVDLQLVIAQYSTVLTEAWFMGKNVLLDDTSSPELARSLADRRYFLLQQTERVTKTSTLQNRSLDESA